jgi:hypothetical protein
MRSHVAPSRLPLPRPSRSQRGHEAVDGGFPVPKLKAGCPHPAIPHQSLPIRSGHIVILPLHATGWRRPRRRTKVIPHGDEDIAAPNPFQRGQCQDAPIRSAPSPSSSPPEDSLPNPPHLHSRPPGPKTALAVARSHRYIEQYNCLGLVSMGDPMMMHKNPDAVKPPMALWLTIETQWCRVTDQEH